jgi:AmiR/NasT family two-component response regulator
MRDLARLSRNEKGTHALMRRTAMNEKIVEIASIVITADMLK